ncbi:hypothetical protein GCM10022251_39120 [Phytohabitans flavus]|uniref:Uncharacterized protein n=1 Tax=Phytohabitans flavus TaxID=1076124 RepID=A0A6F8XVB3_9ACTN|nr:hypothetical protein [Phytohabitans flavus]BCB77763.1 hypothetical protein Pflav_041730 [Phytohabitans flavus]
MQALGTIDGGTQPGCVFPRPLAAPVARRAVLAAHGEDVGEGPGRMFGINFLGCVDFARSTSYGGHVTPQSTGRLTYVPLGVDLVTLAVNQDSMIPTNWSFAQMQRVYKCFETTVANNPVVPRMLESGSSTWQVWTGPTRMSITENEIALGDYPCLANGNGQPLHPRLPENDGTVLLSKVYDVVPFSVAQFVAQGNAVPIEVV